MRSTSKGSDDSAHPNYVVHISQKLKLVACYMQFFLCAHASCLHLAYARVYPQMHASQLKGLANHR